jgi:acetyltransferase
MPDGTELTLRHINAGDVKILNSFVRGLSFGTRYFRYGQGDLEFTEDEFLRICSPNPRECVHLLVVKPDRAVETVVASARIVFEEEGTACEVAITVADTWQLHGIGKRLMNALFGQAKARGHTEMYGRILGTNRRMIEFMRRCGFDINNGPEGPSLKIARIGL